MHLFAKFTSLYSFEMGTVPEIKIFFKIHVKRRLQLKLVQKLFYTKMPKKSEKNKKMNKSFLYLSSKHDKIMKTGKVFTNIQLN